MVKNRFTAPTFPDGIGKDNKNELSIIILAAQAPYKMKQYGPQPLLRDKYNRSILENQVEIFKLHYPYSEIILVAGYEVDKIVKNKPKCVRVVENQLYESTNEVEEARLGLNNSTSDNVLLVFGDIYFSENLIRDLPTKESTIIVDKNEAMLADDVGVTIVDNYATILSYAIPTPKWTKIALIRDKELKLLKQFVNDRNNNKMYLFEGLNYVLNKNGKIKSFKTNYSHEVIHIQNTKELEKIQ